MNNVALFDVLKFTFTLIFLSNFFPYNQDLSFWNAVGIVLETKHWDRGSFGEVEIVLKRNYINVIVRAYVIIN